VSSKGLCHPQFLCRSVFASVLISDETQFGNVHVISILGKRCVFLHGPEAASWYLQVQEDEISFLKGVDQTLGPFLPKGACLHCRVFITQTNLLEIQGCFAESEMTSFRLH
jgi:hypothetical protein